MTIAVTCNCSSVFRLADELAGKKIRCKSCQAILVVPAAEARAPAPIKVVKIPPKARPVADHPADEVEEDLPRARTVSERDDADQYDDRYDDREDDRRRRKKKRRLRRSDRGGDWESSRSSSGSAASDDYRRRDAAAYMEEAHARIAESRGGTGIVNGGAIVGGVLAMLGAVVWFVFGLQVNRIYFYPFFLFVVGFGAVIKGITGQSD